LKGKIIDRKAENNIREVDLVWNDKFNMWIRCDSDIMTLKECKKDYPTVDFQNRIILDIGAHIGGFARLALDGGVEKIISIEPDEYNFDMLNVNIDDERCIKEKAAVVSDDISEVTLYSNGSKRSSASGSLNKLRGSVIEQTVKALNFNDIINKYQPDMIKMDIEGGEYPLLLNYRLPKCVKEIVIEIHAMRKDQKPLMKDLIDQFHSEEWIVVNEQYQIMFGNPSLALCHYRRTNEVFEEYPIKACEIPLPEEPKIIEEPKQILPKEYNAKAKRVVKSNISRSSLSKEINDLCFSHFDEEISEDFNFFIQNVNKRIEWQYGLRDTYEAPPNLPALGPDVEYFGFHLLMDDRMRYIAQNIVAIPDSQLSPANKICNTLISHFYGARGIHQTITKIEDEKEAHIDFNRMNHSGQYLLELRNNLLEAQEKKIPIYGSTELRTSLFGAANKYVTEKYNYLERNKEPANILEWVGNFITDGTVHKILNTDSLKGMFKILTSKAGIGNYYGYHGATSNSVNPNLPFDHDERFVVPGPGSSKTARLMFPGLSEKQVKLGDRVIWVRENQKWILPDLKINEFFYNLPDYKGDPIFENDITEIKSYTAEVSMCQYGIFRRLREQPYLASRRKVSRADDNK